MKCYVEYTDREVEIRKWLENEFLGFTKNYTTHEWDIPALIDEEVLSKCGYFISMPHQLTSVGYISPSDIESVIESNSVINQNIVKSHYFLTPAACLHLYPVIGEKNLYNEIVTTKARVYRYENEKFIEGQRLWDFSVREFVGVGDNEYVKNFLNDFQKKAVELCKEIDLECELRVSNDLFYPHKLNDVRGKMQRVNKQKIELIVNSRGRELALASFNYHGVHFSRAFGFERNGKVVTGCVGFGLDRWLDIFKEKQISINKTM